MMTFDHHIEHDALDMDHGRCGHVKACCLVLAVWRISMCRLYALHANEPIRVECSLVTAQNALMRQSQGDSEIVLTDGDHLVGARLNRFLWFLEREAMFKCDICGKSHVHHEPLTVAEAA